MNSKKTSIALCVGIIMALAMILPAMAATYSLTVTTDKASYGQGASVTISGILTADAAPASGLLVSIKVTDPQGNNAYTTIATTNTQGAYSTSFISQLGAAQLLGTYTVTATAAQNGATVATQTATYTVAQTTPVVAKITLSPNNGTVTTIVGSGFSIADKVTITWGTTTLPTVPETVTVSSSGTFTAIVTAPTTVAGSYVIKAVDQHSVSANATFTVLNLQGPAGSPGPKGDTGANGQAGSNGSNGTNGSDGAPGATGAPGASGAPGPSGVPGTVANAGDMPLTALALAVVALIIGLVAAFIAVTLRRKIAS